jgi:predicted nucleotidyltransferase
MMNPREKLPEAERYLKGRQDVAFAYLFGSVALGRTTHLSDIDIAIYLTGQEFADKRMEILGELIDILKTDNLDLVILNSAPLSLAVKIIQTKIILNDNKPHIRYHFESSTLRSYFDFSKLEKRILENRYLNG